MVDRLEEMLMKRWIGIDPGEKGGIAMIPESGEIELYPMDNEILKQKCREWKNDDCICCLEKVGVMSGQGIVSSGNFMKGVGYIIGVLESLEIPFSEVPPAKWKAELGCKLGKDADKKAKKDKDIEVCHRLFPTTVKCQV